ncbi:MAG: DUF4906 domain-containing protein [Bacteroidales bacterium]|nr:DUF4906 domain-containing protein [Bacteroidales bacterium]
MRRYLRTLFLTLAASLFAVSCVNEMELSEPITDPDVVATLVPHVNNFANQYVTKAGYSDAEKKVSSLSMYIFNNDGVLVHTETLNPEATSVTLKKSMMNTPTHRGKLNNATVLMMANMSLSDLKKSDGNALSAEGLTLSVLQKSTYLHIPAAKTVITSLGEGFTGFPMMGQITMDLTATTAQQEAVALPLQILYAKVNFSISVVSGGENEDITLDDGKSIGFNLSGYSVHNVATVTPVATPAENGATPSTVYAYTTSGAAGNASGNVALGGTALPFTFYVAETRYNPTSDLSGIYPDNGWIGNAAYDHLKQQYKPQVAAKATGVPATGLASYVTLNGTYTDYRGSQWLVNYKIYLGKDNMTNFQVDRNSEYTNYITIKGIRNAGGSGTGNVWIDHRVDASINGDDDASDHVKITRETLLDSHFEVRPLRVQWGNDENGNPEYTGVRLYLPTDSEGNLLNWIGVERFTGKNCQASATYCYLNGKSIGKRRYFTQNLIRDLNAKEGEFGIQQDDKGKFIDLRNGDCAWFYFDENTSGGARDAKISLRFYLVTYKEVEGGEDGEVEVTEELKELVEYTIKQNGLASVTLGEGASAKTYQFESYEEYLHSYDATDTYSLSTSPIDYTQQGLKWGYKDTTLSHKEFVSATQVPNLGLADLKDVLSQRYDYFHPSDDPDNTYHIYVENNGSWTKNDAWKTGRSGLYFTDKAMHDRMETVIDMGTAPKNAYQYCLSKNKFEVTASGDVNMKIHWYLPDAYQLQDILANPTEGLSSEAYYWSSQPSFTGREYNILTKISFKAEDAANARAFKSKVGEANLDRTQRHRIRCLYSKDGVVAQDMNKRIPDGIGVNLTFDMKAYLDPQKSGPGYFNNLVKSLSLNSEPKVITPYTYYVKEEGQTDAELANNDANKGYLGYPTPQNNDNTYFKYIVTTDKEGNTFEGFEVDPDVTSNWQEYNLREGYYFALAVYPGLSNYELDKALADAYKETTTQKKDTKVVEDAPYYELNASLPNNSNLQSLDEDGRLTISFANPHGSNQPSFNFHEYTAGTRTTYTRNWIKPEYNKETREMPEVSSRISDTLGTATYTFGDDVLERTMTSFIAGGENSAKKYAFEDVMISGVGSKGAYTRAKEDALGKITNFAAVKGLTETNGWTMTIDYGETLTYKTPEGKTITADGETYQCVKFTTGQNRDRSWWATCEVNLKATATFTKPGEMTLYVQVPGTGRWQEGNEISSSDEEIPGGTVDTDQLRIYSGNSFTISVSNDNLLEGQQKYKITDIKVYYSGNNWIDEFSNNDNAYARFVNPSVTDFGKATSYAEAVGMEYQENGNNGGVQHWNGDGGTSVTLLLADYLTIKNTLQAEKREYTKASKDRNFYLIVDKIEVYVIPIE